MTNKKETEKNIGFSLIFYLLFQIFLYNYEEIERKPLIQFFSKYCFSLYLDI